MFIAPSASSRMHQSALVQSTCERPDVIGFAQKRRKLLPWSKTLAVTHPTLGPDAGSKSVVVIDLDELGTTGSSQHGTVASASVGMHIFLSGLTVLAFYGTYASVEAIIDSTRDLRGLAQQRKVLKERLRGAGARDLTHSASARNVHALRRALRENKQDRVQAHVQRIFMGGFGGTGATLVGTSILANAKMLGGFAPTTLATAASPLMFAAAPVVAVFGTGIATYEAYKFAKTLQTKRRIPRAFGNTENDNVARALLEKRLRALRIMGGLKGTCYLGLAVGVPAAVFGGPYGLPIMVVSAAGMVTAGVLEGVMTGYQPQLDFEARQTLHDKHAIVDAVADTHRRRSLLDAKRHDKITQYPHGIGGNKVISSAARGLGKLRKLFGHRDERATAKDTVLECITAYRRIDAQSGNKDVTPPHHARCCNKHDVANLMNFLVEHSAMRIFGGELLSHKALRTQFARHGIVARTGKEWHFDGRALVRYMGHERDKQAAAEIAEHTFQVAEKALLTVEPKRLLWRERQLLDMLAEELRPAKAY